MSLDKCRDGFYRPANEGEVIKLIERANDQRLTIRVRGSGHSVAHAIFTDPVDGIVNEVNSPKPPDGPNINISMDHFVGYEVVSIERREIVVGAGMRLGDDIDEDTGEPILGLLHRLHDKEKWMLSATGGITKQTVAGFTTTASAGGSREHSMNDDVCGFRLIAADGRPREFHKGVDDEFDAMVPNLGLFGIVTRVWFRCVEDFTIEGRQMTAEPERWKIDSGDRAGQGQTISNFLATKEYARVEWWPQRGCERVQAWEARRVPPPPGFAPKPFRQFGDEPELQQLLGGAALTALGNLDDRSRIAPGLRALIEHAAHDGALLDELLVRLNAMGPIGEALARFIEHHRRQDLVASPDGDYLGGLLRSRVPDFFPGLLNQFAPFDPPVPFHDWAWSGLPMDHEANDVYMPVEFTEIWVPFAKGECVMELLRCYFQQPTNDEAAYERTGLFAIELYAAKPNGFWLSPAYREPAKDWGDGAFRIDVYWYAGNAGDPAKVFFPRFWTPLRDKGIPFRLHWGKFLPLIEEDSDWVEYISSQYPRWDAFIALCHELDPQGIFRNDYWCEHLGLT